MVHVSAAFVLVLLSSYDYPKSWQREEYSRQQEKTVLSQIFPTPTLGLSTRETFCCGVIDVTVALLSRGLIRPGIANAIVLKSEQ